MLTLLIGLSIFAVMGVIFCICWFFCEVLSSYPNISNIICSIVLVIGCLLIIGVTVKLGLIESNKAVDNIKQNENIIYQIGVINSISTDDIQINNVDYDLTTKVNRAYPIQIDKFKIGDKVEYKFVRRELSDYVFSVKKLN